MFVIQLSAQAQEEIRKELSKVLTDKEHIELGMNSRLSDLEDTITIKKEWYK